MRFFPREEYIAPGESLLSSESQISVLSEVEEDKMNRLARSEVTGSGPIHLSPCPEDETNPAGNPSQASQHLECLLIIPASKPANIDITSS